MQAAVNNTKIDIDTFPIGSAHFQTATIESPPGKPVYEISKRAFDLTLALLLMVVMIVPMLVIVILIRMDSKGRAIYKQTRLGKGEKPFTIYKFRTMYQDAEKTGIRWAALNDQRCTRLGKLLRHSHLDELPQLVNIIAGQMSFVGPRPERPEFYDIFDTYIDGFRQRTMVKPGLTGLAQVNGGYELLPEEKIVYDLYYIENRSVAMDVKCIIKTFSVVFCGKGVR